MDTFLHRYDQLKVEVAARHFYGGAVDSHPDFDAVLDRTFAAAEAGDWETFRSMFAQDAILRQNVGREEHVNEAMKTLPSYTADGTTLRYENVRRTRGESSVTEIHDAVFTKPDGRVVRIDICVVVQFDSEGKITRVDEYLDSAAAAPLRS